MKGSMKGVSHLPLATFQAMFFGFERTFFLPRLHPRTLSSILELNFTLPKNNIMI
jgi:hypothetical protein